MKQQNKWEQLFDEWLDLSDFTLIKHKNNYNRLTDEYGHWSLIDNQGGNIGNIEGDRFENAAAILDRMEIYLEDYIATPLEEELVRRGVNSEELYSFEEVLVYRSKLPDNQWDFDILEMVCYHADDIDLNNCTYEKGE